jgi:hypothetical protein
MGWRPYQQRRLAEEQAALRHLLPDFEFYDPLGGTYVSGWWTSNQRNRYQVQVYLPATYPDAAPDTYVTYPEPLYAYRGQRTIESYGASHAMHTWKSDRPGWVKVCIMRPEQWSADFSLVKILRKSMLWITAYECHRDDGRPIADFLMDS